MREELDREDEVAVRPEPQAMTMIRRRMRMEDGRYIVYYNFRRQEETTDSASPARAQ